MVLHSLPYLCFARRSTRLDGATGDIFGNGSLVASLSSSVSASRFGSASGIRTLTSGGDRASTPIGNVGLSKAKSASLTNPILADKDFNIY